jgi:hypothetical protein
MKMRLAPLTAAFKEGIYEAVVESVEEQQGQFGLFLRWNFMVPTARGEAISVSGLTSATFTPHPKCKCYAFASAIRGKPFQIGEILDTDELVNKKCRVYLVIREIETGGSINNVERVLPRDEPHVEAVEDNPFDDESVPF